MSATSRVLICTAALLTLTACGTDDEGSSSSSSSSSSGGECAVNPEDASRYVVVGFWMTTDCSGDPVATNSFPVESGAACYCWPGNSGENSADTFSCDATARSFTYTQYNSLTCGAGDDSPTVKTVSEACEQDIPPTLYSKILDFGACAN